MEFQILNNNYSKFIAITYHLLASFFKLANESVLYESQQIMSLSVSSLLLWMIFFPKLT